MNNKSKSDSYAAAGVDITAGYRAVELMKEHIAKTMTQGVCSDVGGFGGLFELDITGMTRPVLVSGTDGVGTKLKLAFLLDKHDTVGIDCVAMCVNDIICVGAKPLFFLDYIACGRNVPEKIAQIVKGVAEGCVQSGAALIGGLYGYFFVEQVVLQQKVAGLIAFICAAGAVMSMVGDLAASAIKRNHSIKDYGKIIPGHGGVMDRFDSMIVTAPMIYLLTFVLIK